MKQVNIHKSDRMVFKKWMWWNIKNCRDVSHNNDEIGSIIINGITTTHLCRYILFINDDEFMRLTNYRLFYMMCIPVTIRKKIIEIHDET